MQLRHFSVVGRHYASDVLAGALVGVIEFYGKCAPTTYVPNRYIISASTLTTYILTTYMYILTTYVLGMYILDYIIM